MRKSLLLLPFLFIQLSLSAQVKDQETKDSLYFIKYDGTLKTKYEISTDSGKGRFSVRNSRLGLSGGVSKYLGYRVQVELSSNGQFSVLDLNAIIKPTNRITFRLGQSHVPIYNDYTISPNALMFANRPFVGKYISPSRDIGVTGEFLLKEKGFPILLQLSISNGNLINSPVWRDNPAYSGRVIFGSMEGFRTTAKFYRYPLSNEMDYMIIGGDCRYENSKFKIEAEAMNRHNYYTSDDLFLTYIQGAYSFPINRNNCFKRVITALRWDTMSHDPLKNGVGANRFTVGTAFAFEVKKLTSVLRVDCELYKEKWSYPELRVEDEMNSNKITVEVLVIF